MLQQFGVSVNAGQMKVENIAAVLVTAEMPPCAHNGTRVDVTASSVGDARSLREACCCRRAARTGQAGYRDRAGRAFDRWVPAAATPGNGVQVNHLTVGRVPSSGLIHVEATRRFQPARRSRSRSTIPISSAPIASPGGQP
jgi:flagellar P-ring protein precursor FlgI